MNDFLNYISEEEIREQVERICENSDFKSKILLCRFLRFVVSQTLEGRGENLKGYVIGTEVLGKDADFDPEQDSLVRIHAGRLRRLLRLYYLESGKNDPVKIEIPKGGYQPQFHSVKSHRINLSEHYTEDIKKPQSLHIEPTIAVLPFRNLSGDPGNDYFAYGFSEELSIELTKYEDLKIYSCWKRPESDTDNNLSIYTKYGTRFLIDGSVQIHGEEIRLLVKLMDTDTGRQIWAERYNRDLSMTDLFDIEKDIAEEIGKILGSETGIVIQNLTEETAEARPEQLDTFKAMLQFYYFEAHQSPELAIRTFEVLEYALKNDPESGKINAMLAVLYGNAYALDHPGSEGSYEKMTFLSEKALALEPESQLVRIVFLFRCFIRNDWERFFVELNYCLKMKLNSPMRLGALGFYLSLYGEWEKGKEILDRAMNKHIGYPKYYHGATCLYHYRKNEFKDALREAIKYDSPGLFWGPMLRAANLGQLNRKKEAWEQINHLKGLKPDFEEKAYYLINQFVKEKDLVEKVVEGLGKAGFKISLNRLAHF